MNRKLLINSFLLKQPENEKCQYSFINLLSSAREDLKKYMGLMGNFKKLKKQDLTSLDFLVKNLRREKKLQEEIIIVSIETDLKMLIYPKLTDLIQFPT